MNGYTDTIRRYAMDDRFTGEIANPDGIGEVGLGAEAGQRLAVRFSLRLRDQRVAAARFQVFGCGFTIAACAAAAELAEGRSLDELQNCSPGMIDQQLGGLPGERSYCAELACEALRAALQSVTRDRQPVLANLVPNDDHHPRLRSDNPLYRALLDSQPAAGVVAADRELFAGLLAVADQEPTSLESALNLSTWMLAALFQRVFPEVDRRRLFGRTAKSAPAVSPTNPELEQLLYRYVPTETGGWERFAALTLARIIAARAAQPGHLWIAMGFFERPQLSATIRRHLPALAAANSRNMRWKRFLFKQLCEHNGGRLCKSPVCGDCSDYSICFAPEDA